MNKQSYIQIKGLTNRLSIGNQVFFSSCNIRTVFSCIHKYKRKFSVIRCEERYAHFSENGNSFSVITFANGRNSQSAQHVCFAQLNAYGGESGESQEGVR